jgi:hypothetical protein
MYLFCLFRVTIGPSSESIIELLDYFPAVKKLKKMQRPIYSSARIELGSLESRAHVLTTRPPLSWPKQADFNIKVFSVIDRAQEKRAFLQIVLPSWVTRQPSS